MGTRKYHKSVDYLILAAELLHQNKPVSASKALVKATLIPGSRKALAELDQDQQDLQDLDQEQEAAPKDEEAKVARALARALSLETAEFGEDDGDQDQDDEEEAEVVEVEAEETEETADEVDLENVELEADNTDGQLMRDSVDRPAIDTTKASAKAAVVAKNLRAALQKRFADKATPKAMPKKAVKK